MKRIPPAIIAMLLSVVCAASAAAAPLSILTYNLGLLRIFGSNFVPIVRERAAAAPVEIARFAAEQSPDVIVLQEVWKNAQAKAITGALTPLGYSVVRPKNCTLIGKEGGLLVAVRQPLRIVSWSFTPFRKSTFMDSLARKGVLAAVLENPDAGGARFVLLAAHMWLSTPIRERRWTGSRSQCSGRRHSRSCPCSSSAHRPAAFRLSWRATSTRGPATPTKATASSPMLRESGRRVRPLPPAQRS